MRAFKGKRKHRQLREEMGRCYCVAAAIVGGVVTAGIGAYGAMESADTVAESADGQVAEGARQFNITNARAQRMDALTEQVTQRQITAMDKNLALADDYDRYNKTTFRPLEGTIVREANEAGTPAAQEAAAGAAGSAVTQAFTKNREATGRTLARMGVNPNSGRAMGAMAGMDVQEALAEGVAANTARTNEKQQGWAKRLDAASLGRNLPSQQATSSQIANTNGNSAVANQGLANSSYISGVNSAAGIMNAGVGNGIQAAGLSGSNLQGIGSIAGMALRYGTGSTASTGTGVNTGWFSGNSTDPLSNSNASEFSRIALADNYG